MAASKSEAAQTEPPALPNSDQERPYRAAVVSGRHEVFADQESVQADASTEELPTAVLISRSVKGDSASCTFEAKVSFRIISQTLSHIERGTRLTR